MENILPISCSLLVTEQCNLRCKYCFEHHKNNWMSEQIAKDSIDYLYKNAIKSNSDSVSVTMFGGEPMLNTKAIKAAFEEGYKLSNITNIKFVVNIITNCTILNDEQIKILKEYRDKVNLYVQLSIDGIEEVQNMYRVTIDEKPTWEIVKNNIPKWQDIFKDCPDRLNVHGCINKNTIKYLYENYKYFHDVYNFKRIWYIPVAEEDWTLEDVTEYFNQMNKIYFNILDIIKKEQSIEELNNYAPLDRSLNCKSNFNTKTCGAGINYVTINTNGDIFPCHQIYFNDPEEETRIGSIYSDIDDMKRKIFLDYDGNEDLEGCKNCSHKNCYRCIAANYVNKGSMFSQIKNYYCEMMKIDQYFQNKIKEDIKNMGLLNNTNTKTISNDDCLCNCRGTSLDENNISSRKVVSEKKINYDEEFQIIGNCLTLILEQLEELNKKLK